MEKITDILKQVNEMLNWTGNKIKESTNTSKGIMITLIILNVIKISWEIVMSQFPDLFIGYENIVTIGNVIVMAISLIMNAVYFVKDYNTKIATMAISNNKFERMKDRIERTMSLNKVNGEFVRQISQKFSFAKIGAALATGTIVGKEKVKMTHSKSSPANLVRVKVDDDSKEKNTANTII